MESSDTPDARPHVYQVRVNVPPDDPLGMYAEIMALPSTLRPRYARDLMMLGLAFTRMVNGAGAMADALQQVSTTHAPTSVYPHIAAKPTPRCAAPSKAADADTRDAVDGGNAFAEVSGNTGQSQFSKNG
ncbi:hypothetical protein [Hydrogenophaga sp. 2FB]|uniref:hypothetical protein n=1 Tax=Hydrogenophaga sp. 2FB TaxID=2502187 RepID=UPI0010F8BE46|nr:hypothetical protein [Hydrogenophaga sp. 2FB]